jgi:hypothetical protein
MQTILEPTELAIYTNAKLPALFEKNGCDPIIDRIREEAKREVSGHDISTDTGRKKLASVARKVASSKVALDDAGKELVASLKRQTTSIDAERRRMRDTLDELRDEIRKPLTEYEEREKARIDAHEIAIADFAALLDHAPEIIMDELVALLEQANQLHAGRDWEEFAVKAAGVRSIVVKKLSEELAIAREEAELLQKREEQERLDRERIQREREERIAAAAAEHARKQAEEEARKRVEHEQMKARVAEANRIAAQQKAKRDAEEAAARLKAAQEKAQRDAQEAVERERERVEKEQKAKQAEEAKREANKKHRKTVHAAITKALAKLTIDQSMAEQIILAIDAGDVPHVKILY